MDEERVEALRRILKGIAGRKIDEEIAKLGGIDFPDPYYTAIKHLKKDPAKFGELALRMAKPNEYVNINDMIFSSDIYITELAKKKALDDAHNLKCLAIKNKHKESCRI